MERDTDPNTERRRRKVPKWVSPVITALVAIVGLLSTVVVLSFDTFFSAVITRLHSFENRSLNHEHRITKIEERQDGRQ